MAATADSLVELGNELSDEGRLAEAAEAYKRAAALEPEWSVPWYNLGLNFKRQRLWMESENANRRATELGSEDVDAWWNLGIAATALEDWATARDAWAQCGIDVPGGSGPLDLNYGLVPIRLNPESEGEVVWAHRIDPARAILANVPFPRSGYREGDTVLHDGAPNGHRILNSREVPVFDALQLMKISSRRTTEVRVVTEAEADVDALLALAEDTGIRVEDWTAAVSNICRLCSEGIPHDPHDVAPASWQPDRHIGFSSETREDVLRLLQTWAEGSQRRSIRDVVHHGIFERPGRRRRL